MVGEHRRRLHRRSEPVGARSRVLNDFFYQANQLTSGKSWAVCLVGRTASAKRALVFFLCPGFSIRVCKAARRAPGRLALLLCMC